MIFYKTQILRIGVCCGFLFVSEASTIINYKTLRTPTPEAETGDPGSSILS